LSVVVVVTAVPENPSNRKMVSIDPTRPCIYTSNKHKQIQVRITFV
jgi:hypothetical protein